MTTRQSDGALAIDKAGDIGRVYLIQ